jgi:hypothetical protein
MIAAGVSHLSVLLGRLGAVTSSRSLGRTLRLIPILRTNGPLLPLAS